jgi:hypothetical protein
MPAPERKVMNRKKTSNVVAIKKRMDPVEERLRTFVFPLVCWAPCYQAGRGLAEMRDLVFPDNRGK